MRRSLIRGLPLAWVALVLGAGAAEPPALRLDDATFRPDLPLERPAWFDGTVARTTVEGRRVLVAIADGPLDTARTTQLEGAGAELLGYLPRYGYRVRLAPGSEPVLRGLPFIVWLGELPPHLKAASELSAAAGDEAATTVRLRALLATGESPQRALDAILASGATLHAKAPSGPRGAWRLTADVPAGRLGGTLSQLVALPEVLAVEPVRPVRPLNQDGVWVHQSFVGPAPQQTPIFGAGIFGCGQIVAIADTGQDYRACQFDDATGPPPIDLCASPPCPAATPDLTRRKDILYYNWSGSPTGDDDTCPTSLLTGSGHGTHTSGSIAGDAPPYADCVGFSSANRNGGDGQAPGARLIVQELGDDLAYLNNLGGSIWNLADVAARSGAHVHSFSLGGVCHDLFGQCIDGCTLPYDSLARDADLAMWTYPDLLLVQAAGNAGQYCAPPHSVVTPALAKSPLSVGSVGHATNAGNPSAFSSRGPVFDGRLKPTVAAQGEAVVSAASDANPVSTNCSTCSLDGSSMSAPTAAGLAALVREYYTEGFHVAGTRAPASGLVPSGALLKATLIDGAVPLGAAAPAPDFDSGYGRVQLNRTLSFAGAPSVLRVDDFREGVTTGSVVNHAWDVAADQALRFTLVWSDYPADLNAATARVNTLRLEVHDPLGNKWFQTLDPLTGAPRQTSNPAAAHDPVNVEERLVFENPTPGRWVARVHGDDVPWGPQPFALVARGALADCAAPAAPAAAVLSTPADQQVQLDWNAVPGASAYNVYRSFGSCPGGPWVPVAEALSGTSFLDDGVSGGAEYSYVVTAASDADAFCESPRSECASTIPSGDCFLLPEFRGATSATSDGAANCSITLDWSAGSSHCAGGAPLYNVYRSALAGFTPDISNLVASCIDGTSFSDSSDLVHGATYHYVVRAEDATSGHSGPCRGGNEEGNADEVTASPDGPPQPGTWSDDAGDTGEAKFSTGPAWNVLASGGDGGPAVYQGTSSALLCTDLVSPVLTLAEPGQGPTLSFSTIHDLDYDPGVILAYEGSLGQVEIATGPAFNNWTRVPLSPDYPAFIDFPFNNCPSTQTINNYFSDIDLNWDTYSASLVNWGGNDVKLRFHLSGDFYFPGGHWWIDNVVVTEALVPGACATAIAGPPPVPDGAAVPGTPLRASRSGSDVALSWDVTACPAAAYNVYRGAIGDFTTFTAGDCALAPTGSAVLALGDDSWFLVVATDGAETDGSWSRRADGSELSYAGSGAACPAIVQHAPGGVCP